MEGIIISLPEKNNPYVKEDEEWIKELVSMGKWKMN